MTDIAIQADTISKQYRIGQRQSYKALRDTVSEAMAAPLRRVRSSLTGVTTKPSTPETTIWALQDVSFQLRQGEVVGLIGRNGSGKSTLLKILSRITKPTSGQAMIAGRVGSLLEVGTGFHPELTGRENIYLNGAVLGMKRSDIQRQFDAIVAFAEIEKFVDTPVKRYSSGMYVRLAFAVAAHLEPEILLVDEVLAVGDAAFQKKCLGKMGDVAKEGRTVVLVSHDMTNISVLCDSAILLAGGRIGMQGPAKDVIEFYVNQDTNRLSSIHWELDDAPGDDGVKIIGISLNDANGRNVDSYSLMEPVTVSLDYVVVEPGARLNPVIAVKNVLGTTVFSTANYEDPIWGDRMYAPGHYRACCIVPPHVLNEGTYPIDAFVVEETRLVRATAESAVEYSIYDDGSTRGGYVGPWTGIARPRCTWSVQELGPVR
jgi:lipopolysaccharide transport system ATP-binding protein